MRLLHLTLITTLLLLTACGNDDGSSPSDPTDTSPDTHFDVAPTIDGGTDTQADADENTPITVSGRVSSVLDEAVPGVQVGLLPDRVTTSDADGRFTFTDVEPPYDIVTIGRAGAAYASLYQGLTRPDPVLYNTGLYDPTRAEVGVQITGGLFDETSPPSFKTQVTFIPSSEPASFTSLTAPRTTDASGAETLNISWVDSPTTIGRIVALQWETDANDLPVTYTGFGFSPVFTISDGDMLTDINVALDQPIDDTSVNVTVSSPTGFSLGPSEAITTFQGLGALLLGRSTTAPFTLVAPVADSLDTHLLTRLRTDDGSPRGVRRHVTNITTANMLDIQIGQFRGVLNPPNNAGDIQPGFQFSWEAASDGVTLVSFTPQRTDDPPVSSNQLTILTDDTELTLPDLSSFGFSLQPDADYRWRAINISPFDTIDQAATTRFITVRSTLTGVTSADLYNAPYETHFDAPRTIRTAP